MKQTVTEYDFVQAFDDYGRGDNYSREARFALYDYITQLEEDIGEEIELDIISICCAFSEYSSLEELNEDYGTHYKDIEDVRDHFAWFVPIVDYREAGDSGFLVAEAW